MSNLSVNAIRFLGIDAINKANSGHPGVVMGAAPMALLMASIPRKRIALTDRFDIEFPFYLR